MYTAFFLFLLLHPTSSFFFFFLQCYIYTNRLLLTGQWSSYGFSLNSTWSGLKKQKLFLPKQHNQQEGWRYWKWTLRGWSSQIGCGGGDSGVSNSGSRQVYGSSLWHIDPSSGATLEPGQEELMCSECLFEIVSYFVWLLHQGFFLARKKQNKMKTERLALLKYNLTGMPFGSVATSQTMGFVVLWACQVNEDQRRMSSWGGLGGALLWQLYVTTTVLVAAGQGATRCMDLVVLSQ